ncbi:MAG TPA: DinB family protein [bacterium]|nr:DinB family protein [bacterium]
MAESSDSHAKATLADGLVTYFDYLVRARARLLEWVRQASPQAYTQAFPVGRGSIRATLLHVAGAEWGYVEALRKSEVVAQEIRQNNPFTLERLPDLEPLVAAWDRQRSSTRAALADLGDPDRPTAMVARDMTPPMRFQLTAGGIAGQILFHEIHHRAQIMTMLRQAGVAAENLDYSVLMVERIPLA